ncbi:heme-binding protein [Qipengyuania sp. S6317L1]|uniref:heme-binding protein n=1 Tax=Qipengyuania sp. S6317L1 TaxID=2926410 RepID=UPI001FF698F8|nr:heme-binding protein [Qipengyuania sp. S6317L1]MCK0099981.1 heme-binding protein [Qipengyuania sp. S6317L1]
MAGGLKSLNAKIFGAPLMALALLSCGGGGGSTPAGGGTGGNPVPAPTPTPAPPGDLFAAPAQESLSVAEVQQIIAQAAAQATSQGDAATIAVTDRVGNVLGVFVMPGARATVAIPGAPNGQDVDIQGLDVPAAGAAIAKAITGAYLSSAGNAFSTRVASQIVQEHFPPSPTTIGLESGPLFGVQFSQLPCSDFSARASDGLIGPKRSPLGLSADPGGFPLYKNGVVVGGIGVAADPDYTFDPNILDVDDDVDEKIALAGTVGFEAPIEIRADRISADGTSLRYTDATYGTLSNVAGASFAGTAGTVAPVTGYNAGAIIAGTAYGAESSGIRPATSTEFSLGGAFVMSDGSGTNRFPIRGGTDGADIGNPITQTEATAILEEAFQVIARSRAQIRRPLDSQAQVTLSLVDTRGQILGIVRSADAPIFGSDVSLQKARTATFFSAPFAANELLAGDLEVPQYVQRVRNFLNDPAALTGTFAFADRSGGNLARPYFPDGEVGTPNGPLSRPIEQFNPFSTGLQSALVLQNLAEHLAFVTGASPSDTARGCTKLPQTAGAPRLGNGIQIFPGSVPVYRGNQLIGGIGVSGDGIDQDDMISFLGLHNAGVRTGTINNAPNDIRADRIVVQVGSRQVRLRYINCPFAPFLDDPSQNVCEGL